MTQPAPDWELVRSQRRTLAIQIRQDGLVQVRAPLRLPMREIEAFVRSREDWIRHHLAEIAARPVEPAWGEGRTWWYLGSALPVVAADDLVVARGRRRVPVVRQQAGVMQVAPVLLTDPLRLEAALQQWLRERAEEELPARLQQQLERLGESWRPAGLRLRHMRSRWGSCSRDGRITLNTQLLHLPPACIDYVICHELCHLREFNHGPRFHAWQDSISPDWRQRRSEMVEWAVRLRGN